MSVPETQQPVASPQAGKTAFEQAGTEAEASLIGEFIDFLKFNKKWWLLPILLVLALLGLLIVLAATGAAPFIYTI
jgi:hypothetical protein